ncbi:MAG: DUF4288 domain-containing protein [Chitinophagales bacterium]|nr:DUF4288 domain-containing protein [Chitinophagaceae bacterium]MCB9064299.1 DUF4288 domain-containing protein [Chitinophagales bacterium]
MKSYASQIVFSINCDGVFTGQYDEQWRLVYAEDSHDAIEAAKSIAIQEAYNIKDRYGRHITWNLIAIKDVREVAIEHGSLLNSSIIDMKPVAAPIWENETVQS